MKKTALAVASAAIAAALTGCHNGTVDASAPSPTASAVVLDAEANDGAGAYRLVPVAPAPVMASPKATAPTSVPAPMVAAKTAKVRAPKGAVKKAKKVKRRTAPDGSVCPMSQRTAGGYCYAGKSSAQIQSEPDEAAKVRRAKKSRKPASDPCGPGMGMSEFGCLPDGAVETID